MKYKIATAIIENDKGEILLTRRGRDPFKGKWSLVSGIGESIKGDPPEKGIVQEVNCDLRTTSFIWTKKFSIPIDSDRADENVVFIGKVDEKEINIDPKFSQEIKWVKLSDLDKFDDMAFEHAMILKVYKSKYAEK